MRDSSWVTNGTVGGVLASALAIAGATGVTAQDLALGKAVAEARCGRCHATGKADLSPHPIVLPFRELYKRAPVDMLVAARTTGEIDGHDEMPMFALGREQMAALLSYIQSLQPSGAPLIAPGP